MRIVLITGLSGSGKSTALDALEDLGYYAVDNLPIRLLDDLIVLFSDSMNEVEKLALVVDARTVRPKARASSAVGDVPLVPLALDRVRESGHDLEVLFLDASDDVLERRYSETRRRHPMSSDGSVMSGITNERRLLEPLRVTANQRIDTSGMSVHQLRREVQGVCDLQGQGHRLSVSVMSFGFKHGVPTDADLVFDVRFLPNPYFVDDLRPMTGESPSVSSYVLERPETEAFLEKLIGLLEFLLPQYEHEGKSYLTVAIGCTGGRHRSVALALEVARRLSEGRMPVHVRHRDIDR